MLDNILCESFFPSLWEKKGFVWFSDGDYNVNIFGIRSSNVYSGKFDDTLCVAYKRYGKWLLRSWNVTTDPATHFLKNPINDKGCAILVPGQYRRSHQIGNHRGYEALVQSGNAVKVYRDNNKDEILDYNVNEMSGYFGINIHRAYPDNIEDIGKNSAGCTVFKHPDDFEKFMDICRTSRNEYANLFTYTLIEEKDLIL